jgi:hypothetical protein
MGIALRESEGHHFKKDRRSGQFNIRNALIKEILNLKASNFKQTHTA